jgi:hypothetical protein
MQCAMPEAEFLDQLEQKCLPFLRKVIAELRRTGTTDGAIAIYVNAATFLSATIPLCRQKTPLAGMAFRAVVERAGDIQLDLRSDIDRLPEEYRVEFEALCHGMPKALSAYLGRSDPGAPTDPGGSLV